MGGVMRFDWCGVRCCLSQWFVRSTWSSVRHAWGLCVGGAGVGRDEGRGVGGGQEGGEAHGQGAAAGQRPTTKASAAAFCVSHAAASVCTDYGRHMVQPAVHLTRTD